MKKDRRGYCAWCTNVPEEVPIDKEAKKQGSKCNKCWFTDEKSNWEPKI